jgi:hypothetical protein
MPEAAFAAIPVFLRSNLSAEGLPAQATSVWDLPRFFPGNRPTC